jgi:aldehyde dehydrogenase (NAD+)
LNDGACGEAWQHCAGPELVSTNPSDGSTLGRVRLAGPAEYEKIVNDAQKTWERWRLYPAPKRGQIVRAIGEELRNAKDDLGALVTLEMGKFSPKARARSRR